MAHPLRQEQRDQRSNFILAAGQVSWDILVRAISSYALPAKAVTLLDRIAAAILTTAAVTATRTNRV